MITGLAHNNGTPEYFVRLETQLSVNRPFSNMFECGVDESEHCAADN
jgi:hypothetical protein